MFRSAYAVAAGFVVLTALAIGLPVIARVVAEPGEAVVESTGVASAVGLALALVAGVGAGWVTARSAPRARFGHTVALAAMAVVASVAGPEVGPDVTAGLYPVVVAVGVAGILAAGWVLGRGLPAIRRRIEASLG